MVGVSDNMPPYKLGLWYAISCPCRIWGVSDNVLPVQVVVGV